MMATSGREGGRPQVISKVLLVKGTTSRLMGVPGRPGGREGKVTCHVNDDDDDCTLLTKDLYEGERRESAGPQHSVKNQTLHPDGLTLTQVTKSLHWEKGTTYYQSHPS